MRPAGSGRQLVASSSSSFAPTGASSRDEIVQLATSETPLPSPVEAYFEIANRFLKAKVNPGTEIAITGTDTAFTLASAVSEILPNIKLLSPPDVQPDIQTIRWSEVVNQKTELWPIQYLLPGGAYIH